MNIRDSILDATHAVLSEVLAPDLAEKLSVEILARVQPGIEDGLREFVGFEFAKGGATRGRGAAPKVALDKLRERRKKETVTENDGEGETDDMELTTATDLESGAAVV